MNVKESEAKFRDVFEHSTQGIALVSPDGRFQDVNPYLCRLLGYTREELLARHFNDVTHPQDADIGSDHVRNMLSGETTSAWFEKRYLHKGGRVVWASISTFCRRDEQGEPQYFITQIQDITARKRIEQVMQARLRLLEFAVSHCLDEILQATLDEIEALTGSEISFYHFLEDDQETLSLRNWSTNTLKNMCTASGKGSHYNVSRAGVWVDCIAERGPVLHNDYASLPHRQGLPEGHPPVVREVVVPIIRGDLIKAIIGIGNKPTDYDQDDVEIISQLGDLSWDIVERKRAEEALKESEEKYRAILEVFDGLIYVCSQDYHIEFMNEPLISRTGRDATGEMCYRALHDLDSICPWCVNERVWRGETVKWEVQSPKDDRWYHVTNTPIHHSDGTMSKQAMILDITEFKQAEDALRESEEKFRLAFENANIGMALVEPDGRYQKVNTVWAEMLGYSAQELEAQTYVDVTHPEDRAVTQEHINDALAGRTERFWIEKRYQHKSGEVVWGLVSSSLVRDSRGEPLYFISQIQDITDRKRAEEELQRSNEMLRAIIEAAPTAIMGLDLDGKVHTVWNPAAEKMLGWSAGEVMGRFVPSVPEEAKEEFRGFRDQIRQGLTLDGVEVRRQRRDGTPIDCSIYASPLSDAQGRITGNVAVLVDVSERKRAEAEHQAHLRFLESMDRVNRVIQGAGDLEQMMGDVLDVVLDVFDCDRTFLLHPVDPEASSWTIPMERNRPEYPGALGVGHIPMKEDVAETLRILLAADGPVKFGPGAPYSLPPEVSERFGFKSFMSMVLYPKIDKPWQFGLHQCSYPRIWTAEDERLFQEIGRRMADALTNLLTDRDLRKSEEFLNNLVENIPNMIFVKDAEDLRFVRFNKAGERLLGYSRQELLGKNDYDLFSKEEADLFTAKDREVLRTREMVDSQEETIRNRAEDRLILHTKKIPILDRTGRPQYLLGISEDITERKQAEVDLRESEYRFRELFDNMSSGVAIYEAVDDGHDFVFKDINRAVERIDSITREDLVGRRFTEAFPGAKEFGLLDVFTQVWRTGQPEIHPISFYEDQRIAGWRENYVFRLPSGEIVAIYNDLTERKQAEESVRKLNQAIEQSPVSIVITDKAGDIEFVNPKFTQITGYSREEALGRNPSFLKSGDTPVEEYQRLWKTITSGGVWRGEFHNRKKSGELFWEQATISPIKNAENVITHYVAVKEDITQRKQLESQLRQAHKMEAIGTLAGGIAHDFNNILSAMIGFTELSLLNLPADHPVRSNLIRVQAAGERATNLVQQILSFSRRVEQEHKPIHLGPIVKEALKLLRAALPTTIEIQQDIETETRAVMADPTQIHQVLMNLCANAAHAMQDTGGVLEVKLDRADLSETAASRYVDLAPGSYQRLSVRDTGVGMDAATMERMFEPFFTTKEGGQGTGLGLSVVHGIVKSHGGAITVHSEPGRGATFMIHLPLVEVDVLDQEMISKVPYPTGTERIMFVDDEPLIVEIGRQILEHLGYRVTTALSSLDALERFRAGPDQFDLVITDMTMPQMTGLDLSKELLRIRPDLPIILCTGFSSQISGGTVAAAGIKRLLMKPMSIRQVSEAIREILDGHKA